MKSLCNAGPTLFLVGTTAGLMYPILSYHPFSKVRPPFHHCLVHPLVDAFLIIAADLQ